MTEGNGGQGGGGRESSPLCTLVEYGRELGYERGCGDGVDEAAFFLVFRSYGVE